MGCASGADYMRRVRGEVSRVLRPLPSAIPPLESLADSAHQMPCAGRCLTISSSSSFAIAIRRLFANSVPACNSDQGNERSSNNQKNIQNNKRRRIADEEKKNASNATNRMQRNCRIDTCGESHTRAMAKITRPAVITPNCPSARRNSVMPRIASGSSATR